MPITPNMELDLPTVSTTVGPEWATDLNTALGVVDAHDHSPGKGVALSQASFVISGDLEFNGFDATEVRSVRCESQSAALAEPTDANCYYSVSGNPVFNNGSGTATRLVSTSFPATAGDILYASSATAYGRLGIGTTGQVLKVSAGIPAWASPSASLSVVTASTTYVITSTNDVVLCDDTSASFTVTLPLATGSGKTFFIKKVNITLANAVTIARAGADTIMDAGSAVTSTTINTWGETISLVDAASGQWQILERRIPSNWTAYTPTLGAGFGTTSDVSYFYQRCGQDLKVRGVHGNGTVAAATTTISIPAGLAIGTSLMPGTLKANLGRLDQLTNSGSPATIGIYSITWVSGDSAVIVSANGVSQGYQNSTGSSLNSSYTCAVFFEVPILGWKG